MKIYFPPLWKLYTFLFSMPLISVALNLIMYENRLWKESVIWWYSTPLLFVLGFVSWYFHMVYDRNIEQRFPDLQHSRQRIFRKAMVMIWVMTPSILIIFGLYHAFQIFGYQIQYPHLLKGILTGFVVNLIFATLYEAEYMFNKVKEARLESETISQLSVSQELDTLKNQINPHFLFNCFNTLSSLITIDRQRAEQFLNELSKVYRYLLRNNEEGLSTVENEIKFIHSYFQLLQTRYGNAVQMNIQIDKQYYQYLLPSLSLQLLVENAVKHNTLSVSKPLVIDILTTAGNKLVVSNNLQRRTTKVLSNKVGLENISTKYHLLKQSGFQIIEDDYNFTVALPLIWKPAVSQHYGSFAI